MILRAGGSAIPCQGNALPTAPRDHLKSSVLFLGLLGRVNLKTDYCKSEHWVNLPSPYQKYQVSSFGRVRSGHFGGRILKPGQKTQGGYLQVSLSANGRVKNFLVHRLVLLAFVGESPLHVNHKNFNKQDNHIRNLEYVTVSKNIIHSYQNRAKPQAQLRSKQQKEAAISLMGSLSVSKISQVTKIPRSTLIHWRKHNANLSAQ